MSDTDDAVVDFQIVEHYFSVPLDHDRPGDESITVFVREVYRPNGLAKPYLLFLQGGPGQEAPRPFSSSDPLWLNAALHDFRVLLLDQRGTGRSSPLQAQFDAPATCVAQQLRHYRADSIVRDAECIRKAMGVERWTILGQSFGGFVAVTYLSLAPTSLCAVLITGGLPPLNVSIENVYRTAYDRAFDRNVRYYARYPYDRVRVREIHELLATKALTLPSGSRLTSNRFRQLGNMFGKHDGFERMHYLVELPVNSPAFLHDVETALAYERNPLYSVLQEACYADTSSTRWAAQRTMPRTFDDPTLFFGEMTFDWMYSDYAGLEPMRETARLVSQIEWGPLYNLSRLQGNDVPVGALVYADDFYIDRASSVQAAALIGSANIEVVAGYQHDGLTVDGARIFKRALHLLTRASR